MNMRVKEVPPFETTDNPEVNASLKIQERIPKVGDILEVVSADWNRLMVARAFPTGTKSNLLEVCDVHDGEL